VGADRVDVPRILRMGGMFNWFMTWLLGVFKRREKE
jgi:hypothetical protein